jgi:hypothetical protein
LKLGILKPFLLAESSGGFFRLQHSFHFIPRVTLKLLKNLTPFEITE